MTKKILVLDSTQISSYLECPMQHYLLYDCELTRSNEVAEYISAGSFGHKLLEIYYTVKKLTGDLSKATQAIHEFQLTGEFPISKETEKLVRDRVNHYWMINSQHDIEPLVKYKYAISIDHETSLPMDIQAPIPIVEQGFSYELLNTNQYLFVLEGRIDILGCMSGNNLWMDHKFQFRKRDLYSGSIQFKNYCLATGCNLGIINYIRLHQTISKDTLVRQVVNFTREQLRQWKEELTDVYIRIAEEKSKGDFFKNRHSCGGMFGHPCMFTPLCDETNDSIRTAIRERDFVKKIEWKPW